MAIPNVIGNSPDGVKKPLQTTILATRLFHNVMGKCVPTASSRFFSYGTVCVYNRNGFCGVNAKQLTQPSSAVNCMDSLNADTGAQNFLVYRPADTSCHSQARHAESIGVNFFDAHAEMMRPVNLNAMFQASSDYYAGRWYYYDATGIKAYLTI